MQRLPTLALAVVLAAGLAPGVASSPPVLRPAAAPRESGASPLPEGALGRTETAWVARTLGRMSIDDKVGQLVLPGLNGVFTSTDSDAFERLERFARERRVGGFHVFGGKEALPTVLLNAGYGMADARPTKARAAEVALLLNRLQQAAQVPLVFTADFEGGAGYIVEGATRLPRAMAIGATRDPGLAERAGRLGAEEGRALGVHVDFYPVVDVNNNPRNPIINIRSFGEDPALVSELATAYVRGIHEGGMLATAKHFPGHGDTATDTHLDMAVIEHPRARLDAVELPPFEAAIAGGVDAIMAAHIHLPALDPTEGLPASLSRPVLTGLLRKELGFDGLVFTDSMSMYAITRHFPADRAAAMAIAAGADVVLDPPDPDAALRGIREAVERGEISREQLDRSVERILRAKARLGLATRREVDVAAVPARLGGRARAALAREIAARAVTLLKDERGQVPLRLPAGARVLLLSVVDYDSGWREGAPGRVFVPEMKRRFPDTVAVEVSDRTTAGEIDLLKALARRSDAVVATILVRTASYSGRMDLQPAQQALLEELAQDPARPFVAVAFGNPYVASLAPKLPALLLTYDFGDAVEEAAVQAILGEAAIGGKLPISIPDVFPAGHGLVRAAIAPGQPVAGSAGH
jgi:beta-N-acetylhexosaminidase